MDPRITWAAAEIERTLGAPLSLPALAASVHLSPSRFVQLFRAALGQTPHRYLHALRMERAHALITRTFLSIKEVMGLVGCNDPSHFARDFKRFHGITATDLRRTLEHGPLSRPFCAHDAAGQGANEKAAPHPRPIEPSNATRARASRPSRPPPAVEAQADPPTDGRIGPQSPARRGRLRSAVRRPVK